MITENVTSIDFRFFMCFCSFNGFCWVLWAEVLLSCFWVGLEITYKVILVFFVLPLCGDVI